MSDKLFRRFAIGIIFIWMLLLAFLPYLFVLVASFLKQGAEDFFQAAFTVNHYLTLVNPAFLHIFTRSLVTACLTTFACLLLAYPFAYLLARSPEKMRNTGLFLMVIPFWTSSLIRTYAIISIIKTQGLLNSFLIYLGVIKTPLHILYTQTASQIGLIYTLLPFMIFPLYATLEKFDWHLLDAAKDLGASKWRALWQVVIPLSTPGILSGTLMVLLPAMTLFYIPDILGGAKSVLLGNLIQTQFIEIHNWPLGSAVSVILTLFMIFLLWLYSKWTPQDRRQGLL